MRRLHPANAVYPEDDPGRAHGLSEAIRKKTCRRRRLVGDARDADVSRTQLKQGVNLFYSATELVIFATRRGAPENNTLKTKLMF